MPLSFSSLNVNKNLFGDGLLRTQMNTSTPQTSKALLPIQGPPRPLLPQTEVSNSVSQQVTPQSTLPKTTYTPSVQQQQQQSPQVANAYGTAAQGLNVIGLGGASRDVSMAAKGLSNVGTSPRTYMGAGGNLYYTDQYDESGRPLQVSQGQQKAQEAGGLLKGFAEQQTPYVLQKQAEYNKFAQESPYMLAAQFNPNVAADVASGRSGLLGQTFAQELAAKQQAVTNALAGQGQQIGAAGELGQQALTGRGQEITAIQAAGQLGLGQQGAQTTALTAAGGLTKPEAGAAFFGSPVTGNIIGSGVGGTGNNLIDQSINNALSTIMRGGSSQEAIGQLVGGDVAKTAFIKKMQEFDPSWTETSSNAIASQNMKQGQSYQEQATTIDTGRNQLKLDGQNLVNLLQSTGLNSADIPYLNKATNEYLTQFGNPGAIAQMQAINSHMKNSISQILAATGELTPTEIGNMLAKFDPSSLKPSDLQSFLTTVDALGENYQNIYQSQSQQSYRGSQGFSGGPTVQNVATRPALGTPTTQDTTGQVVTGTGMLFKDWIGGFVSGLTSKVLGQ